MLKMIKKAHKHYSLPTPVVWRKIGDSLLLVSTSVTGYTIFAGGEKWVAIFSLVTGILGKFITNFFKDENA